MPRRSDRDDREDPVRRTRRQLECYYRCVSRDEEPRGRSEDDRSDLLDLEESQSDEALWNPLY